MQPSTDLSQKRGSVLITQDAILPGIIKERHLVPGSGANQGDIIYSDNKGGFTNLSIGTDNQVLTASGGVPTYTTPSYISTVTAVSGTTPTLNCSGNRNIIFTITLSGNTTYSISNAQAGQVIMVEATQGSGTTYANTWFSGITWVTIGATAPIQTTTSSGITTYGFRVLTSSTFLGYLVGTN